VAVLEPGGDDSLAAAIANKSADALGLQPGDAAPAVFKPGAVIPGVQD
jgi:molybdopterin-binding protein